MVGDASCVVVRWSRPPVRTRPLRQLVVLCRRRRSAMSLHAKDDRRSMTVGRHRRRRAIPHTADVHLIKLESDRLRTDRETDRPTDRQASLLIESVARGNYSAAADTLHCRLSLSLSRLNTDTHPVHDHCSSASTSKLTQFAKKMECK